MKTRPLTEAQLIQLRKVRTPGNRVDKAIELIGQTKVTVAAEMEVGYTYLTDVAANRFNTVTVERAHRFADYFGCAIEDLFPAREAVAS